LSKHKTIAAHFSLFSGTQFGKHWARVSERVHDSRPTLERNTRDRKEKE